MTQRRRALVWTAWGLGVLSLLVPWTVDIGAGTWPWAFMAFMTVGLVAFPDRRYAAPFVLALGMAAIALAWPDALVSALEPTPGRQIGMWIALLAAGLGLATALMNDAETT